MEEEKEIDTFNKFFIGGNGQDIVSLKIIPQRLSQDDALLVAAYLVSLSDGGREKFLKVLDAVENT